VITQLNAPACLVNHQIPVSGAESDSDGCGTLFDLDPGPVGANNTIALLKGWRRHGTLAQTNVKNPWGDCLHFNRLSARNFDRYGIRYASTRRDARRYTKDSSCEQAEAFREHNHAE
jgi:hypothetical protein